MGHKKIKQFDLQHKKQKVYQWIRLRITHSTFN